jgi:DNA-directed RNA polymerase subunit omega
MSHWPSKPATAGPRAITPLLRVPLNRPPPMRNEYVLNAAKVIDDPYVLVNVVSRRVKQLRHGHRPLIESLEKLSYEDTALREIAERKITYSVATREELEHVAPPHRAPRAPLPPATFQAHNHLVRAVGAAR